MPSKKTPDSKKNTKPKLAELQKQIEELTTDLQRVQADFINYKRRSEQEMERRGQVGQKIALMALLPTLDNLDRAIAHIPEELKGNQWAEGVIKSGTQLRDSLAGMGLEKIETIGKQFDPEYMDAVQVEGEGGKEVVSQELQSGYVLGDEVLRHAVVKVRREK